MKPVPRLLCLLAVALTGVAARGAEPAAAAAAEPAKGATISANVCVACHTNDGSRGLATNPILQGQHPEYLVKQLTEFKSGVRRTPSCAASRRP